MPSGFEMMPWWFWLIIMGMAGLVLSIAKMLLKGSSEPK